MQTFVPYTDFRAIAEVIDNDRLNKGAVEAGQICNALTDSQKIGVPRLFRPANPDRKTVGWANHSASRMWKGHEVALLHYGIALAEEWMRRGKNNSFSGQFAEQAERLRGMGFTAEMPAWWGDERVHGSHRAMLLVKNHAHYAQFGWPEDNPATLAGAQYFWPA